MTPLPFYQNSTASKQQLKKLLQEISGASLETEKDQVLSYVFVTGVGKFKDDVVFWFDEQQKVIHFRSASRKGWHDMGANRRRMKKISKRWKALF